MLGRIENYQSTCSIVYTSMRRQVQEHEGGTHVTLQQLLLQAILKDLRSAHRVKLDADCILMNKCACSIQLMDDQRAADTTDASVGYMATLDHLQEKAKSASTQVYKLVQARTIPYTA